MQENHCQQTSLNSCVRSTVKYGQHILYTLIYTEFYRITESHGNHHK